MTPEREKEIRALLEKKCECDYDEPTCEPCMARWSEDLLAEIDRLRALQNDTLDEVMGIRREFDELMNIFRTLKEKVAGSLNQIRGEDASR